MVEVSLRPTLAPAYQVYDHPVVSGLIFIKELSTGEDKFLKLHRQLTNMFSPVAAGLMYVVF